MDIKQDGETGCRSYPVAMNLHCTIKMDIRMRLCLTYFEIAQVFARFG